ncbi:hypothetical protein HY500_04605 [Candidatus Woesearchaeota archaeon]|nr:hypothetical protein [Candidatus Woesearchaeota archaeon]
MKKRGDIPFIKIDASNNHDFGFKIGNILKKSIKSRLLQNKEQYKKVHMQKYQDLVKHALKFLPPMKKYFPDLLVEAKAISEGAEVDFKDLLVLMCEEELADFRIPHCTNVAIKTINNKMILGHNEDWFQFYRKNGFVVIKGKFRKNEFLSLNYIGGLAGYPCGLTKKAAFTINSLPHKRFRYGIPRSFQLRALLEAKKSEDITKILDFSKSSISGNTIVVWADSKIIDIEELWEHDEEFKEKKQFIHTNHPLLKRDQNKENTERESILRLKRINEILNKEKRKLSHDTIKRILKNHTSPDKKSGICEHKVIRMGGVTVVSVTMNATDLWMEVCPRNPCINTYKRYYL